MVVLSATILPVAGLLPFNAGNGEPSLQTNIQTMETTRQNDVWPMFRYNPGNIGCSPFESPNTNHLAWKKTITNPIYRSTPLLYEDKLYISTNWDFKGLEKTIDLFSSELPSPEEFLENLLQYQNDTAPGLYCLEAETGTQLWFKPFNAPNDAAIVDDKIYLTDFNYATYYSMLYCLDAATGNTLWQKSVSGLVLSPTIVANEKIYLGCIDLYSYAGSVLCYDISGNPLWNRPLSMYEWILFSAPAVSGGNVYVLTTNIYSYYEGKLYGLDAQTGQIKWSRPVFSFGMWYFDTPSAVSEGTKVYVTDFNLNTYEGALKCYDGATGNPVWTCAIGSALSFVSPAVCGESVYITASDLYSYTNWLYRINVTTGAYLWRVPISSISFLGFGSLICSADKVIITSDTYYGYSNEVLCYERQDGVFNWKYTTSSYILGEPSIGIDRVYFADQAGNIYAIEDVLKIQKISGGLLGVNALIENTGPTSLTNITWSISVKGGSLGRIDRTRSDTIDELQAGTSTTVRLLPVIGLGKVQIVVAATMPGMNTIRKIRQGLVIGSICILLS